MMKGKSNVTLSTKAIPLRSDSKWNDNATKRDFLRNMEAEQQLFWSHSRIFEANIPDKVSDNKKKNISAKNDQNEIVKWFGTFPFPYMNGMLHLGHAFSLSKVEFMAGYQRLLGKQVLFPLGFHATGMPIRACADKVAMEIQLFGKYFDEAEGEFCLPNKGMKGDDRHSLDLSSHAAMQEKSTEARASVQHQYQILESFGIPRREIHKFSDTDHWLRHFPSRAMEDCKALGARIDWRRSFVTTDVNPYFDSFVRWQMNKLKRLGKIQYGERYTIFSPLDGQPCLDHDRSSGEGVGFTEYHGLKVEITQWGIDMPSTIKDVLEDYKVYLIAATRRPELVYGCTNCFIETQLQYCFFKAKEGVLYLAPSHVARNMAFQGHSNMFGKIDVVAKIDGWSLIGAMVSVPLAKNVSVYVLPSIFSKSLKGTGIYISCPSESPEDLISWKELKKKSQFFKIREEWIDVETIPVISSALYGENTAEQVVQSLKIRTKDDILRLQETIDAVERKTYENGKMIHGMFKSETVKKAREKLLESLLLSNLIISYAIPDDVVVSRSNDVCVVALCEQWFLDYGESSWKLQTKKLLQSMNTFSPEIGHAFQKALDWLHRWACSRNYGLGSRIPWDEKHLVESLSDSTIYMAYYTIAHLLQPDSDLLGSDFGPLCIDAKDMKDEVWDFVFGNQAFPAMTSSNSSVTEAKAERLRREFRYFYPVDLRSSGKDLMSNHLIFCMYNHAAIFPEEHWPKSMRFNGHILLNGNKMSKSSGNFLILREAIEKYGADASRIALADAGDGIEDANFDEKAANANILRIYTLIQWCKTINDDLESLREGPINLFWDQVFLNQINATITTVQKAYEKMHFRAVVKSAFYDFLSYRDTYRDATMHVGMHRGLSLVWMRTISKLMMPIAPHFTEYIWRAILLEETSIQSALYPLVSAQPDPNIEDAASYIHSIIRTVRLLEENHIQREKKGKLPSVVSFDRHRPKLLTIAVQDDNPDWRTRTSEIFMRHWDEQRKRLDEGEFRKELANSRLHRNQTIISYARRIETFVKRFGLQAFSPEVISFREQDVLEQARHYIERALCLQSLEITTQSTKGRDESLHEKSQMHALSVSARPGSPSLMLRNV